MLSAFTPLRGLQSSQIHDILLLSEQITDRCRPWASSPFSYRLETAMFILSNFLIAVAKILSLALNAFLWIVIARAVLSWVNPDPYNPIVRFIHSVTEPVLYRIRRWLPAVFGSVDLSPIVVIMAIMFLEHFAVASLYEIAVGLR
jgi:YggT family protein